MCDKKCNKCGVVKALTEYRYRDKLKGSRHHYCNQCHSEYRNARYKNLTGEIERHQTKEWSSDNRDRKNAHKAKRRAAKLERTAAWGNKELIDDFYKRAARLSEATGIPMEVDHVYPLQGELVSGLHIETNLQILPKSVNASKSNTYEVQ